MLINEKDKTISKLHNTLQIFHTLKVDLLRAPYNGEDIKMLDFNRPNQKHQSTLNHRQGLDIHLSSQTNIKRDSSTCRLHFVQQNNKDAISLFNRDLPPMVLDIEIEGH